jgi:membrane-bound lytic murein transglycosylase MltF
MGNFVKDKSFWIGLGIGLSILVGFILFSGYNILEMRKSLTESSENLGGVIDDLNESTYKISAQVNALVGVVGEAEERAYYVLRLSRIIRDHRPGFDPAYAQLVSSEIYTNWKLYGVFPSIQAAVAKHESGWNKDAESSAGAIGLFQVIPSTGRMVASMLKIEDYDRDMLYHPVVNTRIGGRYLALMKEDFWRYETKMDIMHPALTAYNMGPKVVHTKMRGGTKVRSNYSESVLSISKKYAEEYNIL